MLNKREIEKKLEYWRGFLNGIDNLEEYESSEIKIKISILKEVLDNE